MQLTPQIHDGFENDPNKALLLRMHNTNLHTFPALDRQRQMTQEERVACPAAFEIVIAAFKEKVCEVVNHSNCSTIAISRLLRFPRSIAVLHAACGPSPRRSPRTVVSLSTTS